ncbi:MAG TPA: calcium-binding protein, partial [Anaerolineae bacterium]
MTQSDSWSKVDGTSGSDTFYADGSSSGTMYLANGSYSSYTNDGRGGITSANYAVGNVKLSDSWISADGTAGAKVFYVDGSYTITTYAANGGITSQSVMFAQGVLPADVELAWAQTIGAISGLAADPQLNYTTLNLSWGANNQSIQVMIPHSDDPSGSGVSGFTFADGTTLSMGQMIAMAPPAPTFDPQILVYHPGTGVQVMGAGYNSIQFGAGITSDMITLGLGSLMLRVGTDGDVIHIANFDPSNALAPNTIQNFSFADGSTLTYDQLLARGFDIYGTSSDETLTGTNLVNRIYSGGGSDTLIGTGTSDTLVSGAGVDTLIGGTGNETFVINDAADVVVADANAASNSVIASVSYVLPANVQNLTLAGSDDLFAIGNELNNIITGNAGNNIVIGGGGND